MLIDFGKSNWIDKARSHPDKLQQVFVKARVDGLFSTIDSVRSKLDQPIPLGYCNVGIVSAIGPGVSGFEVGDRVVSSAPHAEIVTVPHHLCALIPDGVTDEAASFTMLGAIALQGIRLAQPTLGETFLVSGLGLIGLLTVQLLVANGCKVLGLDPDPVKCSLAEQLGISTLNLAPGVDPITWCFEATGGNGVDGALITAATSSSDPVNVAANACRQCGRIVCVGVTGLDLRREHFFKKQLTFQVSFSFGPGRYDPSYEFQGLDYPIGFVRWTEQRNFQGVLHCLATGTLLTEALITHRFPLEQASAAFDLLSSPESSLGIILKYTLNADANKRVINLSGQSAAVSSTHHGQPVLSFVGAGNYASRVLIPAFAKAGGHFHTIVASSGSGPVHVGRKNGFLQASTDVSSMLANSLCNSVVIATRHDSHAQLIQSCLNAGKHVFVEKPLCINEEELNMIENSYTGQNILMVGFNRRFAPLVLALKDLLKPLNAPKAFIYTCNAGEIPKEHWIQDPNLGGGRLLGEACHFVDLIRHLCGRPIEDLQVVSVQDNKPRPDIFSLQLRFADGSIGSIHYFANGSKIYPKERLEVFTASKVFRLDNFRKLKAWGVPGFRSRRNFVQDKGQVACCSSFLNAIESGGSSPIPPSELFEVQRWLLRAVL